jgi:hypothetical protein
MVATRPIVLLLVLGALARDAVSQQVFPDVDYLGGMRAVVGPQRGRLLVQGDTLTFLASGEGTRAVFAVAFEQVVGFVAADVSRQTAGGLLLHGIFYRKKEKLLSLRVSTADTVATIAFRTERERGYEIAAAIWPHLGARRGLARLGLDSGTFVRVSTTAPRRYVGTLVGEDADSIHLAVPDAPGLVALPRATVAQVEVGHTSGHALQGALIGASTAALVGLSVAAGCVFNCPEVRDQDILLGVAAGAILGGVVGAAIRSPQWQVTYPEQVGLRLAPQHGGGLAVGLSLRF